MRNLHKSINLNSGTGSRKVSFCIIVLLSVMKLLPPHHIKKCTEPTKVFRQALLVSSHWDLQRRCTSFEQPTANNLGDKVAEENVVVVTQWVGEQLLQVKPQSWRKILSCKVTYMHMENRLTVDTSVYPDLHYINLWIPGRNLLTGCSMIRMHHLVNTATPFTNKQSGPNSLQVFISLSRF